MIPRDIVLNSSCTTDIGYSGEYANALAGRRIVYDLQHLIDEFGDGELYILNRRPGDVRPYFPSFTREGNIAYWPISETDTAKSGVCHVLMHWYVQDALVKSETYRTRVLPSESRQSNAPPPGSDWVKQVEQARDEAISASTAAQNAQNAIENLGVEAVEGEKVAVEKQVNADGSITLIFTLTEGSSGPGKVGYTFTPSVTRVENGYEVSWTNDGELPNPEPVIIPDGKQGDPGKDAVVTPELKQEIATAAAALVKVPTMLSELTDDPEHRTVTDAEKAGWDSKKDKPLIVKALSSTTVDTDVSLAAKAFLSGRDVYLDAGVLHGSERIPAVYARQEPSFLVSFNRVADRTGPYYGSATIYNATLNKRNELRYSVEEAELQANNVVATVPPELPEGTEANVQACINELAKKPGVPGVSPTVQFAPVDGGNRMTITDATGEKSVDILNGAKGDTGNTGVLVSPTQPEDPNVDVWIEDDGEPDPFISYPTVSVSAESLEIEPNKFYVWPEMAALTITLAPAIPDMVNEYAFQFTSGASPTTLSVPDTVRWVQPLKVEASKTYQVSIINNVGVIGGA